MDVYLPPGYFRERKRYPLLILNDGQDLVPMHFQAILNRLYVHKRIKEHICVGVYAGNRMQEYGTAGRPDYKKRGRKAEAYSRFIVNELRPMLAKHYRVDVAAGNSAIAGFSLGGLSAFDLAWHHPEVFGKVGVFSGSLWWRSQPYHPEDPDGNRIVHEMVRQSATQPELRFWFQTGTEDETEDRNNNGIIDSIDDTLDLIKELQSKGYPKEDIRYYEVKGGRHDVPTWGKVMPAFLVWAFGE
jgi:enterochelin esterase-like enzyme